VLCFFLVGFIKRVAIAICDIKIHDTCFLFSADMATQLRIFTVKEGEQAIIQVYSHIPITLDFNGKSVTLWCRDGMVFQRIEDTVVETQIDEPPLSEVEETQRMDEEETQTQIDMSPPRFTTMPVPPEHITIRQEFSRIDLEDLEELQTELFGDN